MTNKYFPNLLVVILMILSTSCSDTNKFDILIENREIYSTLVVELSNMNILFEEAGQNILIIDRAYKNEFTKISKEVFERFMPEERSFAVPHFIQPKVEAALIREGYRYTKFCYSNEEYIVLDIYNFKEASEYVDKVIFEAAEDLVQDLYMDETIFDNSEITKCKEK